LKENNWYLKSKYIENHREGREKVVGGWDNKGKWEIRKGREE